MRATIYNGQVFCNGDEVYHRAWDITGVVHVFNDNSPREAQAEVQWDSTDTADELDLVADQLEILS